jgi:hypothetical protein
MSGRGRVDGVVGGPSRSDPRPAGIHYSSNRRFIMQRITTARLVTTALIAACAILPSTAFGAKPVEQFHDRVTDSFSDVLCGIPVDAEVVGTDNFFLLADGGFKGTGSFKTTVTNPANGTSIVISSAGQAAGTPMVDEQAATITFTTTYKGRPEKIQSGQGPILLRDAGVITFADTFDLNTGEFISSDTLINKGPHPEADSDFTRFCEVVGAALA